MQAPPLLQPDPRKDQAFENVFDALDDIPGEAACLKLAADLLAALQERVAAWGLPSALAAQRLRVTRPRLAELQADRLGRLALDDLGVLTAAAGLRLEVRVAPGG